MTGKKENKRNMKGNDSKRPFHFIFPCFMHPPGARREIESERNWKEIKEKQEMTGNDRKWKEMEGIGKQMKGKWKENERKINGNERKWKKNDKKWEEFERK